MNEGRPRFPEGFARQGMEMKDADYADPVRKAEIDRVLAVRDAVLAQYKNEDLYEAYMEFAQTLPKEARLYHYFIGSTPAAHAVNFDVEDDPILARVERFAREHGLT